MEPTTKKWKKEKIQAKTGKWKKTDAEPANKQTHDYDRLEDIFFELVLMKLRLSVKPG